jgi:regulation of enolase protein 1 (concanavalin A-like superfamily)
VRFVPGQVRVVNAAAGLMIGIELTNVARISFPTNQASIAAAGQLVEAVPEGWQQADIGPTQIPGSTRHELNTVTVRGSGTHIEGDADSFHFVFKPVHGDSEIVAEVTSIQYTHPNAKAGLMMRENLNEYARHVMIAMTAMRGGMFQARTTERFGTESSPPLAVFAPHWLKLKRHGDEFTAYTSPNGRLWTQVQKMVLPLAENLFVGLAVASGNDTLLNWTTFSKVREASRLLNEDYKPEVEMISGSLFNGRPERADGNEVLFSGSPKAVRVPTDRVARFAYAPLSGEMAWKTRVSRPGVWVNTGDFFDGEFRGIEDHRLTISSVLYGLRTFNIDDEVLAIVLQPRKIQGSDFEIETADGSVLRGSEVTMADGEIRLRESALGEVRLPAFEILDLRRR